MMVRSERLVMATPTSFTLEEANGRIILMSKIANDIEKTWKSVQEHDKFLRLTQANIEVKCMQHEERLKNYLNNEINTLNVYIHEMESLGVEILRFSKVIVAFPTIYNNGPLHLIWMNGESCVTGYKYPNKSLETTIPIKYKKK